MNFAVVFILLAAAADGLDGFVARKMGSSPLGANLDSLADLISFGTAPVYLAIMAFHLGPLVWPVGIFYLVCGTLRLARFNVSGKSDQFFEGLPIPAAGIFLSASVLLGRPTLTIVLMLLLGIAHGEQHLLPQDQGHQSHGSVWTHLSCRRMVHLPPERYYLCSPSGDYADHAVSGKSGGDFTPTKKEIAAFEAGIKLGALYHQFVGSPVSAKTASSLEKAMQESISLQPYVREVKRKHKPKDVKGECLRIWRAGRAHDHCRG